MTRYFEDFTVGETATFGSYRVTAEEVTEFARAYDPQPFHVDREAAAASIYGGLIASGWHTCAMAMRLIVDHLLAETACLGALGVDDLRFRRPVRPGDELSVRVEVVDTDPNGSQPDRGLVRAGTTVMNQDDEPVLSYEAVLMFARREAA